MTSACMVPTMKHGGGGVMVWGCFACDTINDIFRIQGTFNQHGYHFILLSSSGRVIVEAKSSDAAPSLSFLVK